MKTSIFAAAIGLVLSGCAAAPVPLKTVEHRAPGQAQCLFVLLPGMSDRAETFSERGFVEEINGRKLAIDITAVSATFGYYMRGTFVDRLGADVIEPAKQRGYREIWLIGPSMGGFGSLFYTSRHAADITGALAIAPFLGDKDVITEIADAGGLKQWQAPPKAEVVDRDNYQRQLWRWLQAVTQGREASPLLFTGYGKEDSLGRADALLAAELPPERVFLTPGGHEWPAWRRILAAFLDSPDFSTHCR